MPDTRKTPGEVAYSVYIACLRPDIATWTPPAYAGLDPANQAAWDAAAQAVLTWQAEEHDDAHA